MKAIERKESCGACANPGADMKDPHSVKYGCGCEYTVSGDLLRVLSVFGKGSRLAAGYRAAGFPRSQVEAVVLEMNERLCEPPLDASEVSRIVSAVFSYGGEPETFTKHDGGKLRYSLTPPRALARVVEVLTHGADKYGADNWRKCDDSERYVSAALRHIEAYRMSETNDPDSDAPHLAHAVCSLLFLLELGEETKAAEDAPKVGDIDFEEIEELLRESADCGRFDRDSLERFLDGGGRLCDECGRPVSIAAGGLCAVSELPDASFCSLQCADFARGRVKCKGCGDVVRFSGAPFSVWVAGSRHFVCSDKCGETATAQLALKGV